MRIGFNTNGTTGHRWDQAIELMAEIGYRSVAITIDHYCLNPYSDKLVQEIVHMRRLLDRLQMTSVIETGARFLLDPRQKHEPTLVSPTTERRATRVDFLKRCVRIAKDLGSDAVSFWSGVLRDDAPQELAIERLAEGCRQVMEFAQSHNVKLAFEPEPGMVIQSFADYEILLSHVDGPGWGLTVDIGHVHCLEPLPIAEYLHRWRDRILTVHIEDMHRGVHDHLRFGEGSIDFVPVLTALKQLNYEGSLNVELSRHSHMAPEVMQESYDFLMSRI